MRVLEQKKDKMIQKAVINFIEFPLPFMFMMTCMYIEFTISWSRDKRCHEITQSRTIHRQGKSVKTEIYNDLDQQLNTEALRAFCQSR